MYTPVLVDCVGLEKLQSSLGFVSVIHGISMGAFYPITGMLSKYRFVLGFQKLSYVLHVSRSNTFQVVL